MNDTSADIADLQAELEQLRARFDDELERQKIDALAEFAAGAGHEINNPLAIIGGHAQLLLREIEHPEHRRQLAVIAAQVKRAYEMIADIRLFARPPKPEPTRFDLHAELRRLSEEQRPFMERSGVEFHYEPNLRQTEGSPRDLERNPLLIDSDPVLLHVVLEQLCNNAREALAAPAEEGFNGRKTVSIVLRQTEKDLEIAVEDNGPGVSEEIRPLIFCPYYSGRQAGRGLGFGLPKAWRFLQQIGASIRYETPVSGRGARFVVTLPGIFEEPRSVL